MQEFDHGAGDVDCNHDCSCRVTVCVADDFLCLKLSGREHQQHLRARVTADEERVLHRLNRVKIVYSGWLVVRTL